MPFWKQHEQTAKQVKLQKRLLHQSPRQVAPEGRQNSPIENPTCDPGPAAVLVSYKSSDQQEDQRWRHGQPKRDDYATLEPVFFNWSQRWSPDDVLRVSRRNAEAQQRKSG